MPNRPGGTDGTVSAPFPCRIKDSRSLSAGGPGESGDSAEGGLGFECIRSLSRLRSIFTDFSKKLKATQKAIREMKKTPAWEFARAEKNLKKLNELTRRIHREMAAEWIRLADAVRRPRKSKQMQMA